MQPSSEGIPDYQSFLLNNRIRVNGYLNIVLFCCTLTGPAIALGIAAGVFNETSYGICIQISSAMLLLAVIHKMIINIQQGSLFSSYFAFIAMDLILVQMSYGHISLVLTWFLIPLLSLLLCSTREFVITTAINYLFMVFSAWITTPYMVANRGDYADLMPYFLHTIGGYTIETVIMLGAGHSLGVIAIDYFRDTMKKYNTISDREVLLNEQLVLLKSMARIYDLVNLIDFERMTERPLSGTEIDEMPLDLSKYSHTRMASKLAEHIALEQLDSFLEFTDITTVQSRLRDKKSIIGEFVDVNSGWIKAQYIVSGYNKDGYPTLIIFTVQNIENEKLREDNLIRIAMTDELTMLGNRRGYDEEMKAYMDDVLPYDLAIFSVDVNGLKIVNDSRGHSAGDKLIKSAARCLSKTIGNMGKVFRTGGDEFIAIVITKNPRLLYDTIKDKASDLEVFPEYTLSISVGYAAVADFPDLSFQGLERKADNMMYEDKEAYYKRLGIDRRRK